MEKNANKNTKNFLKFIPIFHLFIKVNTSLVSFLLSSWQMYCIDRTKPWEWPFIEIKILPTPTLTTNMHSKNLFSYCGCRALHQNILNRNERQYLIFCNYLVSYGVFILRAMTLWVQWVLLHQFFSKLWCRCQYPNRFGNFSS